MTEDCHDQISLQVGLRPRYCFVRQPLVLIQLCDQLIDDSLIFIYGLKFILPYFSEVLTY
jgi:hypothetical protein